MNIYKGLLMMHGYLTTVEPEVDAREEGGTRAPEPGPTPGSPAPSPRSSPRSVAVPVGAGALACACD